MNRLADRRIWPKKATDSRISSKNWTDSQILQKQRITNWSWNRPRIADFECFDVLIADPKHTWLARIMVFSLCSERVCALFPLSTRRLQCMWRTATWSRMLYSNPCNMISHSRLILSTYDWPSMCLIEYSPLLHLLSWFWILHKLWLCCQTWKKSNVLCSFTEKAKKWRLYCKAGTSLCALLTRNAGVFQSQSFEHIRYSADLILGLTQVPLRSLGPWGHIALPSTDYIQSQWLWISFTFMHLFSQWFTWSWAILFRDLEGK